MFFNTFVKAPAWQSAGLLIARLIIAAVFGMALTFKVMSISGTAAEIASVGIPFALPLAYIAALFELMILLAFLTGAYFREFAFLATLYVLFLAVAFHGPSHWSTNMDEFGFFVDHFTFAAALIALTASGPGRFRISWGK